VTDDIRKLRLQFWILFLCAVLMMFLIGAHTATIREQAAAIDRLHTQAVTLKHQVEFLEQIVSGHELRLRKSP